MSIYDLHTHHHPDEAGTALVQLTPSHFAPRPQHYYSVGLHPWTITDHWRVQMAQLYVMAQHPQVLLIGEAGIDKRRASAPLALQIDVMREHIHLSELVGKPLLIHCVKGVDELLALRKEQPITQPWILHGYRGGVEQWRQLTRAGIMVSLGERYDEALIQEIPLDLLLLESDESPSVTTTYAQVSASTAVSEQALRETVSHNIHRLLTYVKPSPF